MSYATQGREVFRATSAAPLLTGPKQDVGAGAATALKSCDGDGVVYMGDSQKIQEAVKQIQHHASDIRKEAGLVGTASTHVACRGKVQNAVREAKSAAEDAKRLLRGLAVCTGGTPNERDLRRLTQQKLKENLTGASKGLEAALKQYEAAEVEAVKSREVAHAIPTSSSSSGLEMGEVAADIEEARLGGSQLRALEDVTQAEVDTHAAIAEEYVAEVRNLEQDIKGLQRVMVDLADHAHSQGETLDNIEANMLTAAHHTGEATEQLVVASRYQKSYNKKLMWLLALVFILATTVLVIVAHTAHLI